MKRNGNAECERRENRGAEGAEGAGSGEGVSPSLWGRGLRRGPCLLPRKFFDFFCLAMVHFGASKRFF